MADKKGASAPPDDVELEEHVDEKAAPTPEQVKGWNIYQRMFAAAGMISVLVKRREMQGFGEEGGRGIRYVSHDDAVLKVRGAFQACGILCVIDIPEYTLQTFTSVDKQTFRDGNTKEKMKITCLAEVKAKALFINPDKPEDRYEVNIPSYALDTSDKALGKGISYAKKYALIACSGLMLATGEDVDQDRYEMEELQRLREQDQGEPGDGGAGEPKSRGRSTSKSGGKGGQNAPQGGGGGQGGGNPPTGGGAPQGAPKPTEGQQKAADAVILRFGERDPHELSKKEALDLANAYGLKLGGGVDWATKHFEKEGGWGKAAKAHVSNLAARLRATMGFWATLRALSIQLNGGDEGKAKETLRTLKETRGWPNLTEIDPALLEDEIVVWKETGEPGRGDAKK